MAIREVRFFELKCDDCTNVAQLLQPTLGGMKPQTFTPFQSWKKAVDLGWRPKDPDETPAELREKQLTLEEDPAAVEQLKEDATMIAAPLICPGCVKRLGAPPTSKRRRAPKIDAA